MASRAIENHRQNAEIYRGDALCKMKMAELLKEIGFPKGLFPLAETEEVGYGREAGFLWLLRKKRQEHTYKAINQTVSFATEVTAVVEERRMKKITGVKTRELLLWLSVVEMYIDDPFSGKITFKTGTGLSDSFPVTAFELEA